LKRNTQTDPYARRLEVATAEAAHAVIATALGLEVVEVSIEPDDDSVGHCTVIPPRSRDQARAALVYFAAGWVHRGEWKLPGLDAVAAWSDEGQAFRLAREWWLDDPDTWVSVQRLARLMLRKYAAELRLVCDALLANDRLAGDDVRDLLALVPLHNWSEPDMHGLPALAEQR
jgi:hypothetical protein